MHVSRTLIVDHNSDGRRPMTVATNVPTKGLSSASMNRQQEVAMKDFGAAAADSVQRGVMGGTTAAESPSIIEQIIARVSNMRATGNDERSGVGNVGCEEEGKVDCDDKDDSDSDDEEEDNVQEVTTRGGKEKSSKGRGKGETSASENGEGKGSDGCGTQSSGSPPHGKRKNARQLAFDSVTDVMKTHSTIVADSVDRASKRQYEVLQRQCNIMEREAMTQERQCEVLDTGQRMLCDALLKIASALSR
ncbi:hypothetical protein CBR_g37952 [Chara braunii]|uniref:Uncharacterized protein n=1 Tax=Chara braunii TaxID=69332 RepID=A0A388LP18_CHABU|nr:hypothetical protein CBR_g37952 [Chara braunii]|eukprot:GBG84077.1 hypothetical protein CBR_g37952 [Chara braunii]